jgi:hypothetical protein
MSDGISDTRSNDEDDLFRYWNAIIEFLQKAPALVKLAEIEADDGAKLPGAATVVKAGACCRFNEESVHSLLRRLLQGDKKSWAKLLARAYRYEGQGFTIQKKLKELSPFKGQRLAIADYGMGFMRLGGDVERDVSAEIRARGMCTYDCDKYLVVLGIEPKDVIWLGAGASHGTAYDTPMKEERAARQNELRRKKR